jgi:prephenate dehydrogenase
MVEHRSADVFQRITIVGIGLIGGSVALAVRQAWPGCRLVGVDRAAVVETAIRLGVVDEGGDDLKLADDSELILLAAPVRQNIQVLRDLASRTRGSAIVTDVGSTKRATLDAARHLPARLPFVGGHPLAGAATGGVETARADLFRDRPWILTPVADGHAVAHDRVSRFVSALGAIPRAMEPIAHDRLMAYLSHLPQLTVSALMHVVGTHAGKDGLSLAGTGLRDTTRLASSPASTWRDVTATNVDAIGAAIDDLTAALQRLKADLTVGQQLQDVFASAASWKQTLEASGSADPSPAMATRTYLEMTDRSALRPARGRDDRVTISRRDPCTPELWRHLYATVGADYHWFDRLSWTDDQIRAYLAEPGRSVWVMTLGDEMAGYYELHEEPEGGVEIVYFGLLPGFIGRGLGGQMLTDAIERAWATGARRVWLHTCSFDHPSAIENYKNRGFTIFKTEQYAVQGAPLRA